MILFITRSMSPLFSRKQDSGEDSSLGSFLNYLMYWLLNKFKGICFFFEFWSCEDIWRKAECSVEGRAVDLVSLNVLYGVSKGKTVNLSENYSSILRWLILVKEKELTSLRSFGFELVMEPTLRFLMSSLAPSLRWLLPILKARLKFFSFWI